MKIPGVETSLPDSIDNIRAAGGYIHDLPPSATHELAHYGIYTTTEPRDPGSFLEYRQTLAQKRAYMTIAENVGRILGTSQIYRDVIKEGVLGERLTSSFSAIEAVDCEDIHLAHAELVPEVQKGIVTASRTHLTVATSEQAERLGITLQALLATSSLDTFYPLHMNIGAKNGLPTVTIGNLDEHAARSLSRSVDAVITQDDKKRGVRLPLTKRPYQEWIAEGETFPPEIERRLLNAVHGYALLGIRGEYRGRPDLVPRQKPRIIGNDSAAFFEGIRDIFNGLIHDPSVRGGSHQNPEQHPIEEARPLVEFGVDLRRDKATLDDVLLGPISNRSATLVEKGIELGHETLHDVRKRPGRAIARAISNIISAPTGFVSGIGSAVKYLPAGIEIGTQETADYKAWLQQKADTEAGGRRLDEFSRWLRRRQDGLIVWEKPNWLERY